MASVLQQLESNEAVLLMYLAGELPAEDRTEVERMLAVDAGLRADLERLREAFAWFSAEVARDDRAIRPAVSEGAAVRRVGRAMRQWYARRLAAAPAPRPAAGTLRYPWWAYPLAAAASVVIAFLVWWGNTDRTAIVAQHEPPPFQARPYDDPMAALDPVMMSNYKGELIARSLGFGEFGPESDGLGAAGEWDDAGSLYAAVAPSDTNVLMLLNNDNAPDDNDAAPDDEPI